MAEPDRNLVGSLGNSSDGMVLLRLAQHPCGGTGMRLGVSHDGWNGHATLDGHSVARLERLCGIALEALATRGYDVERLREMTRDYVTDDSVRQRLGITDPTMRPEVPPCTCDPLGPTTEHCPIHPRPEAKPDA